MKILARVALFLAAACCRQFPANADEIPPCPERSGVRSADAASRAFETAQLRKDRGTLDHMLSQTFLFVHGSGKVGDRRDFLAAVSDPGEVFTAFDIVNRRVIPVGCGGAIVAAEATVHGVRNGVKFEQHFRYDDTYASASGTWQVVYTQITILTP